MSATKKMLGATLITVSLSAGMTYSADATVSAADQLGWVTDQLNMCGGYYVEQPFVYPVQVTKNNLVEVTGDQSLFSQKGTTFLEGNVTLNRYGQQLTANKAYLYRDPTTGKLSKLDMIGNVHLREPNTLVIGKEGHYNFVTKEKTLTDILYRTSMVGKQIVGPTITEQEMQNQRRISGVTAWGFADEFSQTEPRVYDLSRTTYTTCPPVNPAWHVKASHIIINKNTGRGHATNARIYVKSIPVFYFPYIDFSVDRQRKSGFLWPTVGASNKWGPYVTTPYYWNLAPNYDMTITPGLLTKRGIQLTDSIRYLTETSTGTVDLSILPNDLYFQDFQKATKEDPNFSQSSSTITQAEFNRLMNDSPTRKGLFWRNAAWFNKHWSSHLDVSYAGDDYYMRDFGSLNQITQNQLLQQGDISYKGENWNFISRIQMYQTLHPVNETNVQNQYRRFPQIVWNGDYPDQKFGLEYFINDELTHFDIRNTPGTTANQPIGNRLNIQPGISLPINTPYFYINPRMQIALTEYNLYQVNDTGTPTNIQRHVPIFDLASGLTLTRDVGLFSTDYQQTLEPQIYYTRIPYRNQISIPTFDTTVNTLSYDQLFNYNRFTGIDRIGDANQVGVGVATRFINQNTGEEKIRLGVGEILYFSNRRVTFCNNTSCTDNPFNPDNHRRLSPISGLFNYNVNPLWNLGSNALFNPITKTLDNSTMGLHYKSDETHILNFGYGYVRNGDVLAGLSVNSSKNNLKLTDFSFIWPVYGEMNLIGRWTENWNQHHLQNLLYGLQYDTCCWAVRLVGGTAFTGYVTDKPTNNTTPKQSAYNNDFYIQFTLKGLGNVGSGDPTSLLRSIAGYNTQFGQEF